jgi:hypothetical protein
LGFAPFERKDKAKMSGSLEQFEDTFRSAGFFHPSPETNAIIEDKVEEEPPSFVTPGGVCCNWVASVTPLSK